MRSQARRVAITGIGAVTPIGHGAAGLWQGVLRGQSAVRPVTRFDASQFRARLAAEVADFCPEAILGARQTRRLDRFSQFAVAASLQAMADAGLDTANGDFEAAGCYVGSALGGIQFAEEQHVAFLGRGMGAVQPSLALSVFGGAASTNVAMALGLRGPSLANSNSCASGAVAIGEAFRYVRDGGAPVMLAGGVEVPLGPLTFGSFAIIKAMSVANDCPERASRPFDAQRDGFVMGEGAAMLVLEDLEHAQARGATVYAEVVGYAMTNDAHNMLAPLPDGQQAARAIRLALADAELSPDDVEYVNAHASGTPIGDTAEAAAIRLALGPERARQVPVSGQKGLYGHPLGASAAIEAAICALALEHGFVPGTANLYQLDEGCDLNVLGPAGLEASPRVVVKNAFGFGGINAALVLARVDHG